MTGGRVVAKQAHNIEGGGSHSCGSKNQYKSSLIRDTSHRLASNVRRRDLINHLFCVTCGESFPTKGACRRQADLGGSRLAVMPLVSNDGPVMMTSSRSSGASGWSSAQMCLASRLDS